MNQMSLVLTRLRRMLYVVFAFSTTGLSAQVKVAMHTVPADAGGDLPVGGWSGICTGRDSGTFHIICDKAPGRSITIRIDSFGSRPVILSTTRFLFSSLKTPDGIDPEAIRMSPDGKRFYWANEADSRIYTMAPDGGVQRAFDLPEAFRYGRAGMGPVSNGGLESLALSPDGSRIAVAPELPLIQDLPCQAAWSPPHRATRILILEGDRMTPVDQLVYLGEADHGITDMFWDEEGFLWVLERAWSPLTGCDIKVYKGDPARATRFSPGTDLCKLDPATTRPLPVRLVLNMDDFRKSGFPWRLDNVEGIAVGPRSRDGTRDLILVSDNNFSAKQETQLWQIRLRD